ncbi:hypothetical protein BJX99DRAFT_220176 [Aspergillus californicus]
MERSQVPGLQYPLAGFSVLLCVPPEPCQAQGRQTKLSVQVLRIASCASGVESAWYALCSAYQTRVKACRNYARLTESKPGQPRACHDPSHDLDTLSDGLSLAISIRLLLGCFLSLGCIVIS